MYLNLASVLKDEWAFKPGTVSTAGISSSLSLVELGHTGERPGTEETLATIAAQQVTWLSQLS